MASSARLQIAAIALLAVTSRFVVASRDLKQSDAVSEAELFAQKWLSQFLEEAAVARFGAAPTPSPDAVLEELDPSFLFADYEDESDDSTSNVTTIEIDPWNPPCLDPSLPVLQLEGRTFTNVNKEKFSVYVPAEYEVMAWAVSRVASPELEDGVTAVLSKQGGLDFTVEVGDKTNRNMTVCGSWVYSESAVYTWAVYADKDAEMEIFYSYRPHNGNGAAARVFGSYLDQEINFSGGSAVLVGGSRNAIEANFNSDLQQRDTGNDITFDNRVKGDVNDVDQNVFVGQRDYLIADFQGK